MKTCQICETTFASYADRVCCRTRLRRCIRPVMEAEAEATRREWVCPNMLHGLMCLRALHCPFSVLCPCLNRCSGRLITPVQHDEDDQVSLTSDIMRQMGAAGARSPALLHNARCGSAQKRRAVSRSRLKSMTCPLRFGNLENDACWHSPSLRSLSGLQLDESHAAVGSLMHCASW